MKIIEELINTIEIRKGTLNYQQSVVAADRAIAGIALAQLKASTKSRDKAKARLRQAQQALFVQDFARARLKAQQLQALRCRVCPSQGLVTAKTKHQ